MIERDVDFDRMRSMRCGTCWHEWKVDDAWVHRFDGGGEACPHCGTGCTSPARPDYWVDPADPLADDAAVKRTYWYHSSTHRNWPDRGYDPGALFDADALVPRRIAEQLSREQKTKALHLGTYEAAIENMLRRMADQDETDSQFFLYRVRLDPDAIIAPGIHAEPTDWIGDVQASALGGPGTGAFRYVNTHEDPSSVSLAVTIDAIEAVQRISIPVPTAGANTWVDAAEARLLYAATQPPPEPQTRYERARQCWTSALLIEARQLADELGDDMPTRLRGRVPLGFDEKAWADHPRDFPTKLAGIVALARNPHATLRMFDAERWRSLST